MLVRERGGGRAHLTLPRALAVAFRRLLRRQPHLAFLFALLAPDKLVSQIGIVERVVLRRVERDFGRGLARFFGQEEGRVGELFGFAGGFARAPFFRSFAVFVSEWDR